MSGHDMTIRERVFAVLRKEGRWMSPTEIGQAIGYSYETASSRVAPALKKLLGEGVVERHQEGRKVVYRTAP